MRQAGSLFIGSLFLHQIVYDVNIGTVNALIGHHGDGHGILALAVLFNVGDVLPGFLFGHGDINIDAGVCGLEIVDRYAVLSFVGVYGSCISHGVDLLVAVAELTEDLA